MKVSNVVTLLIVLCQATSTLAGEQITITEETIHDCSRKHPIFAEALVTIPDQDFGDPEKSRQRISKIKRDFESNPQPIRECLESIMTFTQKQGDESNTIHVTKRLREITGVVYTSAPTYPNEKNLSHK